MQWTWQTLARAWRRALDAADPQKDRGRGPLERCRSCGEARRDVIDRVCEPCTMREW